MEVRMQFPRQDGLWLLISASPVEYESEPAFMVSLSNITRRKQVELALEHERKNLTERVKERDTLQAVLELTAKKQRWRKVLRCPRVGSIPVSADPSPRASAPLCVHPGRC